MNIFIFEMKGNIKSILIWASAVPFFLFLYMAFFPSLAASPDSFNSIMEEFPAEVMALMGINPDLPMMTIMGYFSLTMSFVMIPVAIQASNYGFNILSVEEKFDRKRAQVNAPRTCDIDIVDFNGEVINILNKNISLEIPHPRLEKRSFVLYPIREIDKNWKSPLSGKKIDQLIENLDAETKKNITII